MSCPPSDCSNSSLDLSLFTEYLYVSNSAEGLQLSSQIFKVNNGDSRIYPAFVPASPPYNLPALEPLLFRYTNLYQLVLVTGYPTSTGSLPRVPSNWPNYKLVTTYNKTTGSYDFPFFVQENVNDSTLIDKWGFVPFGAPGTDGYKIHPCKTISCENKTYVCPDLKFGWERNPSSGILSITQNTSLVYYVRHQPASLVESYPDYLKGLLQQGRSTYNLIKITNFLNKIDQFYTKSASLKDSIK